MPLAYRDSHDIIPESLLTRIWKGQWLRKGPLPISDGRVARVRFPGRENKDSGPDFLEAVIVLDDEILTGDVELHVRSSDWRAHKHHLDPHFNDVILHVVLLNDTTRPACLQNESTIPTLVLQEFLNDSLDELAIRAKESKSDARLCGKAGTSQDYANLSELLDLCGSERFFLKSASFQAQIILEDASEVLYQGIMGALGYVKNTKAFRELAHRLPLAVLEGIATEYDSLDRTLTMQAALLGAAGLLPSQSDGKHHLPHSVQVNELESAWDMLNIQQAMTHTDWHFFRMHPMNFPSSRLLAFGDLLARNLETGLLGSILNLTAKASPERVSTHIERGLIVPGYLGSGRAREIAVNVVLPFAYAWAEHSCQDALKKHVLGLYRSYPKSAENRITRYMGEVFSGMMSQEMIRRAQDQQGMIHLYKTFCQDQRCHVCPVP